MIEDNYKHEIENRIILLLKENPKKCGLAYYNRSDFKEIELINLVIARIFIDDYKPNELELIIQVRMTWLVTVEADERWEQFTPWANLSAFFKIDEKSHEMGTLSYSRYKETNTPYPLDDFLVPVISRKQREGIAERLLEIYYKEVLEDKVALDPHILCSRLNLKVLPLPLNVEGSRIRGQVYFRDYSISVIENGAIKTILIERGTIVVDDKLLKEKGQGAYNFTIVHECIHWILHQKAAMLANIIHSNMTADENLHLSNMGKNSHSHMETQANGIASCMMIPKRMCIEKVEQSQEDYLRFSKLLHFIEEDPEEQALRKIEWAVREIANIYKVSITSAKIRLIDLGYEEAMGVLNYVDDRYLTRYAFSEGSLSKSETVSIKERDFLKLLETSPEFRTEIHNRNYIYIDSHVVKNEEKYLQ